MRTIRVTGRGQLRLRPDTTRVTMTLSGLSKDYAETLRRSAGETEELKEANVLARKILRLAVRVDGQAK